MAWIPAAIAGGGAILGGLLSKQGGPQQQVQQRIDSEPYAPTIPYLNEILQRIQQFSNTPRPLPYATPQDMVAPLTPEQTLARDVTNQGVQTAQGLTQTGVEQIQPFLNRSLMDVNTNPYLQNAINMAQSSAIRPLTQAYTENVLPSIGSQFSVGTDAYDQSREGIAKGIASRGYLDAVANTSGNIAAQMSNRGYETGLQATQGAFSQLPGLSTAAMAPGQMQWNIGALLQQHQQNLANAPGVFDAQQQERNIQGFQLPANLYTQIGQIGRQGSQLTQSPGVSGNPYLGAVGGAILANQAYNLWPQQQQQPFNPVIQDMVPGQFSTGNPQYG